MKRWIWKNGSGRVTGQLAERALVDAFLAGRDERVFRTLYQRYTPGLYRVAWRMIGARNGDAEELVQVTWIRALEKLDGFRWESSLGSWLTGIAINCCREVRRARQRQPESAGGAAELGELAGGAAEVPQVARPIARAELERAIADLPDGYRDVLLLHDVEGYTHEQIGTLLGIESGTSKSQLCRARRALRAKLSASDPHVGQSSERVTRTRGTRVDR